MIQFILCFVTLLLALIKLRINFFKSKADGFPKFFQFIGYSVLLQLTYERILKPLFNFRFGPNLHADFKHDLFKELGSDILLYHTFHGATVLVADPEFIGIIAKNKDLYVKPVETYGVLDFFGKNVVTVEGTEWRRHRKIVGPAFSETNNRIVFDVTLQQTLDMMNSWEASNERLNDGILIYAAKDMIKLTLHVISAAGFGKNIKWSDSEFIPNGHKMTYPDALETVSSNVITKLATPSWLSGVTSHTRNVFQAFDEFNLYIGELIQDARKRISVEGEVAGDLLSQLVRTSDADDSSLSKSELSGNIFILLLAGHETTAHTLAFALALLAIHKDIQEKLYQVILKVAGDSGSFVYEDLSKLDYALAIFNETLRTFPIVSTVPKKAAQDIELNIKGKDISIKKDTMIHLSIAGVHYNPKYWNDPNTFNPDRFLQKDQIVDHSFIPFSEGLRSCVGKRFAQIEGTLALALIVQKYEILLSNESDAESILDSVTHLTLTPKNPVKLLMKKRH